MSKLLDGDSEGDKSLKGRWAAMNPRMKQLSVYGGIGMVVVILASSMSGTGPKKQAAQDPRTRMENALIPKDKVSDLGSAAVSQDLRDSAKRVRDLEGEVARLKQRFEKGASGDVAGAQTSQRMQSEMQQLRQELNALKNGGGAAGAQQSARPQPVGTIGPGSMPPQPGRPGVPGLGQPEVVATAPAFGEMRTIGATEAAPQTGARPAIAAAPGRKPGEDGFYLPSGSIIRGVLLNGVDAPTGRAALKDPVPVLARIKHEAILPNRYRADVKECFVILDAIGDLPSERVMMRTSTLSCVRKDKTVIDMSLKAYAVGEDGRAGLRGIVISKQGAIIAKALVAGFAEGAANAFGGNNQLVAPNQSGEIDTGRSGRMGVMGGASSALDRVAAYYLDLADQMHPIIEIDSARRVSLVVLQGSQVGGPQPTQPGARTGTGNGAGRPTTAAATPR